MGWAGSLVVSYVSIGLPEQGAYQLLPMLRHLFFLYLRSGSQWDGKKTMGSKRRGRKKKTSEVPGRLLFTSQVFLPLVALIYLLANPVVQDVVLQSGQPRNGALLPATLKNHTKSKDTIYAWDTTAISIKKGSFGSFCLIDSDVLSGN